MVDVPGDPIIQQMLERRKATAAVVTAPGTPSSAPFTSPASAPAVAPASQGEEDPIVRQMLERRNPDPRINLDAASRVDPDAFARARKLSIETGLPAETVERNLDEVARQQAVDEGDFWLAQSGATKKWVDADPDNLKLSHDSTKQLGAIEQGANVLRSLPAGAVKGAGQMVSGTGQLLESVGYFRDKAWAGIARAAGLEDVAKELEDPVSRAKRDPLGSDLISAGGVVKDVGAAIGVPEDERNFATDTAEGLGQLGTQITALLLTGGAGATAMMFAQGADQAAEKVKKVGADETVGGEAATLAGGAITAAVERFGLGLLWNKIPAHVKSRIGRMVAGASTEAVSEIMEDVANNIAAIALYDEDQKIFDNDTFYQGGVGGAVGAIASAAIPGRKAMRQRKQLEKVVEDFQKSPLTARDPDKAIEHFAAVLESSGTEFFVPAEKLSASLPPEALADLGLTEATQLAAERGGDVLLSADIYARLAADGTALKLLDDTRVGRDSATAAEAKDSTADAGLARDAAALAEAEKAAADAPPAADEPYKPKASERRQLVAAGFSEAEIDVMSAEDVRELVTPTPPKPDKWHGQTNETVTLAEDQMGLKAMFATAQEAGMSEAQYASYLIAVQEAGDAARKRTEARILREENKKLTEEWKSEREIVRDQVAQTVRQELVYAALDSLGTVRLSKEAIVEVAGQDALDTLPKNNGRVIYESGGKGVHPDALAEQYGFDTGRDLIDAIFASKPIDEVIDAETDRRMAEKHSDILDEQRRLKKAVEDLHNDSQAEVLKAELEALRGSQGQKATAPGLFKRTAEVAMSKLQVREIDPKLFLDEETRKGKQAGKLIRGKGKVGGEKLSGSNREAAARAKYQQILNFEMARQAFQVRREVEVMRKQLARLADPTQAIPGIDADHRDMIFALTEGFDFGRSRVNDPAGLRGTTHYGNMSLAALSNLYQQVKAVETQGKKWQSLLVEGRRVDFEQAKADMLGASSNLPVLSRVANYSSGAETRVSEARGVLAGLSAAVAKMELVLQKLDGGFIGPWYKTFFQPMAHAEQRANDMRDKVLKPLMKLMDSFPKEAKARLKQRYTIAGLGGQQLYGHQILMIALNAGNESNLAKMVKGAQENGTPWTNEGVDEALSKLGREEAAFVQRIWDTFEALRPQIEEIYRGEFGISPSRVQPRAVEIGGVTVKGGYYPMAYDPKTTPTIQRESTTDVLNDPFIVGSVFSGMTKERVEGYAAPVLMKISDLPNALGQAIHYATHFEAIKNARRALHDKDIQSEIRGKLGPEMLKEMERWVGDVATNNSDRSGNQQMNAVSAYLRNNMTSAVLGASFNTLLAQTLGLGTSVMQLGRKPNGGFSNMAGVKWLLTGIDQYIKNPKQATEMAMTLSGELRHRLGNSDRDVKQTLESLSGKTSPLAYAQQAAMYAIAGVQLHTVDIPTWIGAFNKGIAEGKSDTDAIEFADSVLRTSQSSGHVKDLAWFQRQKGVMRGLSMFSTYTTLAFGLQKQVVGEVKSLRSVPGAISRMMWLIAFPAVLGAVMKGESPPDDAEDDEKRMWWAMQTLKTSVQTIPIVGFGISSALDGYDANVLKLEAIGDKVVKGLKSFAKVADPDEEFETADYRRMIEALGFSIGIPGTVQLSRTLKAIEAEDDASVYQWFVGYKAPK